MAKHMAPQPQKMLVLPLTVEQNKHFFKYLPLIFILLKNILKG